MPRVYTQKKSNRGAERRCGRCGTKIETGETYFQYSFRYGGTHYRCKLHRPRQSELTQSKMSQVYAATEDFEDQIGNATSEEEITTLVQGVGESIREVAEEYAEAADAMGAAGEYGESRERAEQLEGVADECDSWSPSTDLEEDEGDDYNERLRSVIEPDMRADGYDPDRDEPEWVAVLDDRMQEALEIHLLERIDAEKQVLVEMVQERQPMDVDAVSATNLDDPLVRSRVGENYGINVHDGDYAARVEERLEELVAQHEDTESNAEQALQDMRDEASEFIGGLDLP